MKIWITLPTNSGSLMAGGLERCEVWFSKPSYQFTVTDLEALQDNPVFNWSERNGLGYWGWVNRGGNNQESKSVSFGRVFGFGDGDDKDLATLATTVWTKIKEHIGVNDIRKWEDLPPEVYRHSEFLLELDIHIALKG